jgi:hypothetical protein
MKVFAVLLCGFLSAALAADPAVPEVRTVYLLSMSSGLDQYLANRLTRGGVVRVVTDPSKADAIVTERLGPAFEQRMQELLPKPKPVEPPKEKEAEKKETVNQGPEIAAALRPPVTSLARTKGTVFLVSAVDGAVLWSVFEPLKGTTPQALDRTAERIADLLVRDLKPKPSQ